MNPFRLILDEIREKREQGMGAEAALLLFALMLLAASLLALAALLLFALMLLAASLLALVVLTVMWVWEAPWLLLVFAGFWGVCRFLWVLTAPGVER